MAEPRNTSSTMTSSVLATNSVWYGGMRNQLVSRNAAPAVKAATSMFVVAATTTTSHNSSSRAPETVRSGTTRAM